MRKDAGATMNLGILKAFAKSEEADQIKSQSWINLYNIDWLIETRSSHHLEHLDSPIQKFSNFFYAKRKVFRLSELYKGKVQQIV